ncbi:MAG: hypothetical protein KDE22_11920 [Rhodobacterales bacterium]|nr:hypothetical protein [Rhodobacterales bacterium]
MTGVPARSASGIDATTFDSLLALRRDLHIAHHVPGRLRLRFGAAAVTTAKGAPLQDLKRLAAAAAGVRSYRLSPHSLSVVVDYDRHRVPPALWHALIEGSDGAARTALETLCSPV